MMRYWIGWYSGGYEDEGCITETPFQYWWTGQCEREHSGLSDEQYAEYNRLNDLDEDEAEQYLDLHGRSTGTAVAMVEAENEDEVWAVITQYFPDCTVRFCKEVEIDFSPGDRFGDFEGRVSLYDTKYVSQMENK